MLGSGAGCSGWHQALKLRTTRKRSEKSVHSPLFWDAPESQSSHAALQLKVVAKGQQWLGNDSSGLQVAGHPMQTLGGKSRFPGWGDLFLFHILGRQ